MTKWFIICLFVRFSLKLYHHRFCTYLLQFAVQFHTTAQLLFLISDFVNQNIFRNPKELKPFAVPMPEHCNLPASGIHASSDSVVIVDIHAPAAYVVEHKWQPNTPDGQGTPFLFQHAKATTSSPGGALMRMFKSPAGAGDSECHFPQALAYPASGLRSSSIVVITSDKEIITGTNIFPPPPKKKRISLLYSFQLPLSLPNCMIWLLGLKYCSQRTVFMCPSFHKEQWRPKLLIWLLFKVQFTRLWLSGWTLRNLHNQWIPLIEDSELDLNTSSNWWNLYLFCKI